MYSGKVQTQMRLPIKACCGRNNNDCGDMTLLFGATGVGQ